MSSSILLIQSSQPNNSSMGTGFIIHQDSHGSYLLTCAHVIEQVVDPKIEAYEVEIRALGSTQTIDLALLYLKGVFRTPLALQQRACPHADVQLIGYSIFTRDKYQCKTREAMILGEKMTLQGIRDHGTYHAWQIVAKDNYEIEHGNSGGPLICKESGRVIAVVSNNKGVSEGYAIAIEHLGDIWKDIPPFLFESDDERESPFVGLSAFGIEQAHLFFGRDKEITEILNKLREEDIIAVVGDSGSGKSSLIKAGVIPKYLNGWLNSEAEASFHLIDTRPARHPFDELSLSMMQVAEGLKLDFTTTNQLKKAIKSQKSEDILNALEYLFPEKGAYLLLYIDQFEELFTLCDDADQKAFIALLLYLLENQSRQLKIKIILTIRRDYYNLISEYEAFFKRTQESKYTLRRMQNEQIKACIEKPLERTFIAQEKIQPFVKAVLQDMGDKSSELALLQIALTQTWRHKKEYDNNLLRTYHEIGEVSGALAKLAQDTWSVLSPLEQKILKYIFIRIIQPGETGGVTRRLADREEFSEEAWHLAQKLSSALDSSGEIANDESAKLGRLLNIRGKDGKIVELTHEALVRQWPRYQRWLKEVNRDHLKRIHDRVIEKTKIYQINKSSKFLLMGYEREESLKLLEENYIDYLSEDEIAYIKQSQKRHQLNSYLKQGAVLTLVGLCLSMWYFYKDAEKSKNSIEHLIQDKLYDQSLFYKERFNQPLKAKLLAGEALAQDLNQRDEVRDKDLKLLYNSIYNIKLLSYAPNQQKIAPKAQPNWEINGSRASINIGEERYVIEVNSSIRGLSLSDDQQDLLVWTSHEITLWHHAENTFSQERTFQSQDLIYRAKFSHDGSKVASISYRAGSVTVWDRKSEELLSHFNEFHNVKGLIFNQEGDEVLVWGGNENEISEGKVLLWDLDSDESILLMKHDGWVYGAMFHHNEEEIWSWSYDKHLKIWDKKSGKMVFQLYNRKPIRYLYLTEDEDHFYTLSTNEEILKEWQITRATQVWHLHHKARVNGVAFSQDKKQFVSWSQDGRLKLWDSHTHQELFPLPLKHHRSIWEAGFTKDQKHIFAWGKDRVVRVWDIQTATEINASTVALVEDEDHPTLQVGDKKIYKSPKSSELKFIKIEDSNHQVIGILKHDSEVRAYHVSQDKNFLLSCDQNHVYLWDLKDIRMVLKWEHRRVIDAAFTEQERAIVSWGYHGDFLRHQLFRQRKLDNKGYLLEAEVESGVRLHNGEIEPLLIKEWQATKKQYIQHIKK